MPGPNNYPIWNRATTNTNSTLFNCGSTQGYASAVAFFNQAKASDKHIL